MKLLESRTQKNGINLEGQLRQALHRFPSVISDAHLQETILQAGKAACQRQNRRRISFARFLWKQIPLIGWKLWCIQGIFLLSAYGVLSDFSDYLKAPLRLAKLLFCLSIAVFMTALPLLYRSARWRMQEIEAAARFSSIKLLLSKLIVIAIGDLSLLGGIFLTALVKTSLRADTIVIYLCFPFLLAGGGCLFMLGHFPPGRFLTGCLLFCSALALTFAFLPEQRRLLFQPTFSAGWAVVCGLLFAFCAHQIRYLIKTSTYVEMQLT